MLDNFKQNRRGCRPPPLDQYGVIMIEEVKTYSNVDELDECVSERETRSQWIILGLVVVLTITFILCLFIGPSSITWTDVLDVFNGNGTWTSHYIVYNLRIPRSACAALVGAGLAIAGMAMQAMFKNPMASPSVLGLSSGASFGASMALAFGIGAFAGAFAVPAMAFIFCLITMLLVYSIAMTRYGTPVTLLLLSGIAVGAFFNGLTSFVQYLVEPDVLQSVVYWTMGSFNRCTWDSLKIGFLIIGFGIALILLRVKELNLISLGEEQAESLGVNIRQTRLMLLVGTSLTVGGCVAISGSIGFVGLIIPHVCRAICGPNHKLLAPLCILSGAIFMMLMDLISKTITSSELPVGILTALLGAPFFVYIMRKKKNEIWG